MKDCGNHPSFVSRRDFLNNFGMGLGGVSLAALFGICSHTAEAISPLASKPSHFPVKAKSVIQIVASGAPSQVDTFDYKPILQSSHEMKHDNGLLLASPFKFNKYGKSGLEISEVWDKTAQHADSMTIVNSMFTDIPDHNIAQKMFNTGSAQLSRPSLGSWVVYGLGTTNQNMPGFISIGGAPEWRQASFLPGMYQGCNVNYRNGMKVEDIIPNITSQVSTLDRQRHQIDLAKTMNEQHLSLMKDVQLESRIEAFETAFKMQVEATEAFNLSKESDKTKELYGKSEIGNKFLIARRLVERGTRFVQIEAGGFDHHNDIKTNMARTAARYDEAIAGLITDLKQRGLLDSTLIIWGGEFGRTVTAAGGAGSPGRDHNAKAFSIWMAGGNVKGGMKYGSTDDLGQRAEVDKVHIHDLHATVLHLMGFDHKKLLFNYNGREFRLTDNFGNVVKEIIA